MSITSELVKHIRAREATEPDLNHAALFFLDALSSAYAGSKTDIGRKLITWATEDALNSRSRAFLVGALTHITETDDLHRESVTHPGCIVIPCVMALSPKHRKSDIDTLHAVLSGFEAMCRIGNAVGPAHYKIWHNTATCGPFGSAMAAAELLELDDEKTVDALGNAGTQSSGLWQFLETGAMSKHLHAGRGSESGLLAAELAHLGFTGSHHILEGNQGMFAGMCPDASPEKVLANPDHPWQLTRTSIKPWPSCRHTHPAIDAALEIQEQAGNKIIDSVTVETYQSALDICDRTDATNEYQAKFSLQHCVVKALLDGEVTLGSFNDMARQDTASLRGKVTVKCSEPFLSDYPDSWGARVTVKTSDGTELSAERKDCRGDPELPLNAEEMISKAKTLMESGGLKKSEAENICDQVMAMPKSMITTDFMGQFMRHIV